MFTAQTILRALDHLAARFLPPDPAPAHQQTGRRGEEDAYFYLRKLGYVMVARNFRSPHRHGEIDLIGWQDGVLCFIEVKTRTSHDVKPAEAAVDRDKLHELKAMAGEYMRHLHESPEWRIDVLTVYYEHGLSCPVMELFKNACPVS